MKHSNIDPQLRTISEVRTMVYLHHLFTHLRTILSLLTHVKTHHIPKTLLCMTVFFLLVLPMLFLLLPNPIRTHHTNFFFLLISDPHYTIASITYSSYPRCYFFCTITINVRTYYGNTHHTMLLKFYYSILYHYYPCMSEPFF